MLLLFICWIYCIQYVLEDISRMNMLNFFLSILSCRSHSLLYRFYVRMQWINQNWIFFSCCSKKQQQQQTVYLSMDGLVFFVWVPTNPYVRCMICMSVVELLNVNVCEWNKSYSNWAQIHALSLTHTSCWVNFHSKLCIYIVYPYASILTYLTSTAYTYNDPLQRQCIGIEYEWYYDYTHFSYINTVYFVHGIWH